MTTYLRTNFRLSGNTVDRQGPAVLTELGALVPTGFLTLSGCALFWFMGDRFIGFVDCSHSTGA